MTPLRQPAFSSAYSHELKIIFQAIRSATEGIRKLSSEGLTIFTKADGSPVTNADIEVDRIVRKALGQAFPQDGWLSEERPDTRDRLEKSRVWILDPIDGTRPFTKALPQYTISLALADRGKPVLGVIVNPATGEQFSAVAGEGAHLNGTRLAIPNALQTRPTFLVSGDPLLRQVSQDSRAAVRCRPILGSIAYSLALVASGHVEGVINLGIQHEWDIAAGLLIVQDAGGIVFDRHSDPICLNKPHPTVDGIIAVSPQYLPLAHTLFKSAF